LQRRGYWTNFVDPSSGNNSDIAGRPCLGKMTDGAYRKMAFKIEDLGCCKVLQHAAWGSPVFVGTIFTDASVESQIVLD
ncbi:hypothetical protein PMAYCL1PPCAC_26771, partial [Pristionchus mayeri]